METLSPEAYPAVDTDIVRRRLAAVDALDEYLSRDDKILYEPQAGVMHEIRRFIADNAEGQAWGYVSLPTGSGKTVLFQQLAEATGLRTLVVTPQKRLVEQAQGAFDKFGGSVSTGLLYTHEKTVDTDVVITTGQSLIEHTDPRRGLIKPQEYQLLILDEAHRALGPSTQDVIRRHFGHTLAIGFTATKQFDQNRHVEQLLPSEIYDMPITEAVEKRLISPFSNMVLLSDYARLSTVSIRNGEYEPVQLNQAINTDPRNRALAEFYDKNLRGQRAVFFCNSIGHSETMAQALRDQGIDAQAIHSKLNRAEQQEIYERFERPLDAGGLEAVCSVRMLTEGFDSPSASVCINVSPTLSLALEQQRSGRVQRLDPDNPGKHALIIDVVDHTDLGLYRPPVIYSHQKIAGVARFTSNGYNPPFDPEKSVPIAGLELMHQPADVQGLAEELSRDWVYEQLTAEGWYTVKDIADQSGYSLRLINLAIASSRQRNPELFDDPDMVDHPRGQSSTVYSEAMAEQLINAAELVGVAPPGWLKGSQIAILAGFRDRMDLQIQLKTARARLPSYHVDYFVDAIGQGNAVQHFSPKAVNVVLEPLGRNYDPNLPAEGWANETELAERYGQEVLTALHGPWGLLKTARNRSHLIKFGGEPHFSPQLQAEIDSIFAVPEGHRPAEELCREYDLELADFQDVIVWARNHGYQLARGHQRVSSYGISRQFVNEELFESWGDLAEAYRAAHQPIEAPPVEPLQKPPAWRPRPPMKERIKHLYDQAEPDDPDFDWKAWEEAEFGPASKTDEIEPTPVEISQLEPELYDEDEADDDEDEQGLSLKLAAEQKVHEAFPYWWRQAECSHVNADAFFPDRGASTRKARELCTQCKVSSACLVLALEANEKFGIWGGVSERPRRELKKILKLGGTWDDVIEIQQQAMNSPGGINADQVKKMAEQKQDMLEETLYKIHASELPDAV